MSITKRELIVKKRSGARILRVISRAGRLGHSPQKKSRPRPGRERLSGVLLGLTCVLAVTFGKKVSQ